MSAKRRLRDLIAQNETWLTAQIIHYAKERGYTPFTSTLQQAWLASIRGLSAPLIAALDEGHEFAAVTAETDYARDPIALYGIEAAKRHRTRGVTLGLFLGLMKSYRETYLDLVAGSAVPPAERRANRLVIDSFFDRMEVGFCDEWAGKPADEQFEQLRAQNRLMTNEKNKYLTIFESLKDPVILVDVHGKVENANHAAFALFAGRAAPGASYYGGERFPIDEILGGELLAVEELACERLLPTNLGPRWFDVKTQRMLDVSEKYLGAVVILNDVTEYRRAREEAERADRAKSSFLATMSHEIRTPIHGILGLAELMRQSNLEPQDRRYVEAIARSGEMLSSVVSDILDYSKIEAGVLDLEEVEFSVAAVIEDVFGLMLPLASGKPDLRLVIESPRAPNVVGDPGKLRQILLNLIGNAIKFTERGAIRLAVSEVLGSQAERTLLFEVFDTGIGVADDKLSLIFDPFTQSDGSVAKRFGGSGLGLAICRRLVERLGGEIGVESRLGEGSRFWFTAPFAQVLGERPTPGPAFSVDSAEAPFVLDVLVVEDNEVNAMVACGLLERAGHRPCVAPTGAAALAQFEAQDFDVVLMDLRLPDMDGLEVTRRIRGSRDPVRRRVPIIAWSAQVVADDMEACFEAGIDDFLSKPFRLERLQAALKRALGPISPRPPTRLGEKAQAPTLRAPRAETGTPGADEPIDASVLSEHVAVLGLDQTARIVATFEASVADAPAQLERLASAGERRELAEIAHRLKSSSLHVGLIRLSERASALELGARDEAQDIVAPANEVAAACRGGLAALKRRFAEMAEAQPANT